jgi:23S rRNA (cytidine1920-2'-O)/16S rRNA (cytidine1409-2'-O)-methyltransferase
MTSRGARPRLDVWLVEAGLAPTREKAQALVMAGRVRVGGQPAGKPGTALAREAVVEVLPGPLHVGRGALKLAGALDVFLVSPAGRVAVDVGASTGGFTETLLVRGACRVYAVDVGRGQIHESLRADPRVVVREGVNARTLSLKDVPEPCSLATMDVSFISVSKILPALRGVLAPGAEVVTLVKPQFEVGRGQVGRGGIVKDPELHRASLLRVARGAMDAGYAVRGACASPILGTEGNREFFLHLGLEGPALTPDDLPRLVEEVVAG